MFNSVLPKDLLRLRLTQSAYFALMPTDMNSSLITYAVSLHFSTDASDIISQAVRDIAEATGNDFIIENKIPPHITIGAFHAAKANEARLLQLTEEFARRQKAEDVHFTQIDNFKGKVLFLKGEKNLFLAEMNLHLHSLVLSEFESGENGYYLPEIWCPHTTLATRLKQGQFEKAQAVAEKIPLPLKAKACEIGFYQCSPFLELKRFALTNVHRTEKNVESCIKLLYSI